MKAVIVEDEIIAAQNLQRLIAQVNRHIEIIAILKSIEDGIEWFSLNPNPDLVFMDIHLSDGASFSIFEKVKIHAPIIFTTAYDEYALKAFEVNSIDYLLKPINRKDLERAIHKFSQLNKTQTGNEDLIANMLSMFQKEKTGYKTNFLIPHKDKFIPLYVNDIAYIYSENKMAKMVTFDKRTFYESASLDEIQRQIDPARFFRANRQFIISHKAIKDIAVWFDGKLSVNLIVEIPEKIIVSRLRASELKEWYSGK
ncbi:MAG: LytTR family DNA-binding domain-containing protein [Tannerella sp.]|jgi:two-component system LytT family response regulator|nr:LytTR family DNA-binding domain-containing protein [Tannerella sp.]